MQKELTFIVPSYNMEAFLPKCLGSLGIDRLQKEMVAGDGALADSLEVIVVNDGSSDNTSEVAHQFEKQFPDVVKVIDKANGNYGSCVNAALRIATGRYVHMLDADDYLESSELIKYLRFLLSVEGEADLVVNDYDEIEASGSIHRVRQFTLPGNILFPMSQLMESKVVLGNYNIAYRRDMLIDMGYRQSEGISYTDTEWHTLPMLYVKSIIYCPGMLMHYLIERSGQTMEAARFVRNIVMLEQIVKRLVYDFEKCQSVGLQDGRTYARKRILALLQLIYTMVLVGYKSLRAEFDLPKFDDWLKSTSCTFYNEMDGTAWFTKCPFHYVREWRRHRSDRTWRFYLFRVGLRIYRMFT